MEIRLEVNIEYDRELTAHDVAELVRHTLNQLATRSAGAIDIQSVLVVQPPKK